MKIRAATKKDLKILNKNLHNPELPWLHERALEHQEEGDSLWFVVWKKEEPLAHLEVQFKNPKISEIKDHIKICPHLSTLFVKENYRRRGIAKKLIIFAENVVKNKGYNKIGISVEKDNRFLKNLYKKLGYKDWGNGTVIDSWEQLDSSRNKKQLDEECNYLVKELRQN